MKLDVWILIGVWCLTLLLLILLIPRDKRLEAHVSFLFMQMLTWPFGALVVEQKLLAFPVGLMHYAMRSSFSFEYFIFPSVSAIFNIRFPVKSRWYVKGLWIIGIPGVMTAGEAVLETYTDLVKYIHWNWSISWLTMTVFLMCSYWYYRWFFNRVAPKFAVRSKPH